MDYAARAMRVLTVAEARELDRDAVERLTMPSLLLMENAARGVADAARRMGSRFRILCGPGNNGGDGLAAARHLGPSATVFLLQEPDPARCPDAATQLRILRRAGVEVSTRPPPPTAAERWVWLDALFGTGLARPLAGAAAEWVECFNRGRGPKLCVDIPSGLHGDTGELLGTACRADVTVTFEAAKQGLVAPAARPFVGKLVVVPLGLPAPGP
ncbi:MAG: NAD(P)H-hydrate epimerase [Planctomycetota bacterium]